MGMKLLGCVAVLAGVALALSSRDLQHASGWPEPIAAARASAEHAPEHQPRAEDGALLLGTGEHLARFEAGAARLASGPRVGLAAMGRSGSMRALDLDASARVVGPEVQLVRAPGVLEWWRSLAIGLEQGVTLQARPEGEGELVLVMQASEGVRVELEGADAAQLVDDATGARLARYGHVAAIDADGVRVPAHIHEEGGRLVLRIDDGRARYPLVVDPLVEVDRVVLAPRPLAHLRFGAAVAIAEDGSRVVTGAGDGRGGFAIYERSGALWTREHFVDGTVDDEQLGASAAITADGSRVVVGAPFRAAEGGRVGYAAVWRVEGSTWTEEDRLLAAVGDRFGEFGGAVTIDAAGDRVVVGAPRTGIAVVFVRNASGDWREESVLDDLPGLGTSVALSGDGSRVVVGRDVVPQEARVYVRTGSFWSPEATLAGGEQVTISADGSRALVADTDRSGRVYVRVGTTWTVEGTLAGSGAFGASVALTSDGRWALVGEPFRGIGGDVRVFARNGSAWVEQGAIALGADGAESGRAVSVTGDGARVAVGGPGAGPTLGPGVAVVLTFDAATGTPCSIDAQCSSGFCVDEMCCASACGGSASDCQACSAALTGGADGTCAALSATAAPLTACRAAAGLCDVVEVCTAGDTACPADVLAASGVACGGMVAGSCGGPSACNGASAACPSGAPFAAGTTCRRASAPCDAEETCDGVSTVCPADALLLAGSECRGSMGVCDVSELCDGVSSTCPPDLFLPVGLACGGTSGSCATSGNTCPGDGANCSIAAGVRAAGEICLPAAPGSECDVPDTCDGASAACLPAFATNTTRCGTDDAEACEAPDHCAGTTALCVEVYLAGVECRPSVGACDLAETCTGAAAECPPNGVSPGSTVCRASSASCDEPEACDGVGPMCPADVTRCEVDGGPSTDAGAVPPPPADGCGCRARSGPPPSFALVLLLALVAARRGQRPRR